MFNLSFNVDGKELSYQIITQEKAKELMEINSDYIILDVRSDWEFENGRIKGALNLPNEDIGHEDIKMLPDKEKMIFVYCRSGHRSKQAASKLAILGYKNIYEFGGIITWDGEIER
ncbi:MULTISPECIES: rhodanese-like domain-containing protein [unclassified Fusobacterium]|uniref:rhodanese-like domain-containing protein n=1 Tax=unclassified Fusobacterium TaxID=2648384 RepID=UPI00260CC2F1|nr:rhodanese-like domain-containing protein [Fusobacterium sp.]